MKFTLVSAEARDSCIAVIRESHGMEVIIRKPKQTRSLDQNALYWKWIDHIRMHIADTTGNFFSAEELHEWLKNKFLPIKTVEIDGQAVLVPLSTRKLSVQEMSEYMTNVDRYCADSLHLLLPTRGDV